MVFNDYLEEVKHTLSKKYSHTDAFINENLEYFFEAYINDVSVKSSIKKLLQQTLISESITNKYNSYKQKITKLLNKIGYKTNYKIIENLIKDYYTNDIDSLECINECIKTIKKYKLNEETSDDIDYNVLTEHLTNMLVYYLRNSAYCTIKSAKVTKSNTKIDFRLKLFELENIDTSVKGVIKDIDKQLKLFLKQNMDNGSNLTINGYQVKNSTLYCACNLDINFVDSDGFKNNSYNTTEIRRILKLYINIFKTFAEQNKNLYNKNQDQ